MARSFQGDRLVVASHNPGKVAEIADLLAPFRLTVLAAADLGLSEPEETGTTFAENARIKAESASRESGLPALADDSGLVVPALDGAPGIYSARWAGPEKDFRIAMEKVGDRLKAVEDKRGRADPAAHFVCALALARPDGETAVFEGRVDGRLVFPPRGDRGFGYDPIFQPAGHDMTFGEMDPAAKHAMSHRADAFAKLIDACFTDHR